MDAMQCAVWYWSHGSTGFWLCDDEDQAVRMGAVYDESLSVAGVQFEDGTYVERDAWPALKAYEDEQYQQLLRKMDEERRGVRPPPPAVTEVQPPFSGPPARTTEAVPDWMLKAR